MISARVRKHYCRGDQLVVNVARRFGLASDDGQGSSTVAATFTHLGAVGAGGLIVLANQLADSRECVAVPAQVKITRVACGAGRGVPARP